MLKYFFLILYNFADNLIHQTRIVNFLKDKNVKFIIDIGAHKGEFLKKIKSITSVKRTYSVEPQKKIFNLLKKQIDNKFSFAHNLAISNKRGIAKLEINDFTMTSTFSKVNKKSRYFKIKNLIFGNKQKFYEIVKTETLDQYINRTKLKKIDLLKIDTEGHELTVVKSGPKTLKKVQYLLIEFRKNDMYADYSSLKLHNFLIKKNFTLLKSFKFPLFGMEDRVYKNLKYKI